MAEKSVLWNLWLPSADATDTTFRLYLLPFKVREYVKDALAEPDRSGYAAHPSERQSACPILH